MKKLLILIIIFCAQSIFSQTKTKDSSNKTPSKNTEEIPYIPIGVVVEEENPVYNTAGIEVKPEFPGGVDAMNSFIKQNFKSTKEGLKGRIYATFIIEKDGSLSDIKILRDLGYETGAEAIRVLKLFPKWSPGKQNNKIVRVLYSIPMTIN